MTSWRDKHAVWQGTAIILGFAGLAILGFVLLGPLAGWLAGASALGHLSASQRVQAVDDARGRLLQLAGGIVAVGALFYNARNHVVSKRTYELAERGQVTDRYARAIEQLASQAMQVRLGAIYGLEHIARDSPPDHQMVMDVLCAFVRGYSPLSSAASGSHVEVPCMPADVRAAMQVIGRRDVAHDQIPLDLRGVKLPGLEIYDADLSGCFMPDADLSGCSFHRVRLQNAKLMQINWQDAHLVDVGMSSSILVRASFQDAYMERVNLVGSDLSGGCDFSRAEMLDVRLAGANLEDALLAEAEYGGTDFSGVDLAASDLAGMVMPAFLSPDPSGE